MDSPRIPDFERLIAAVSRALAPDRLPEITDAAAAAGLTALPEGLEDFVNETFVLPCEELETGVRVDFIFSSTPYESRAIDRAVEVQIRDESVPFAAAEGLILHKLFAGRPRDREDATGVVRRKGEELDWDYVRRWAEEFAQIPGREEMPEQVAELFRKHGQRG